MEVRTKNSQPKQESDGDQDVGDRGSSREQVFGLGVGASD